MKQFKLDTSRGICANIAVHYGISIKVFIAPVARFIKNRFPQYFSGDRNYPILHEYISPKEGFDYAKAFGELWSRNTAYGRARIEIFDAILLDWDDFERDYLKEKLTKQSIQWKTLR